MDLAVSNARLRQFLAREVVHRAAAAVAAAAAVQALLFAPLSSIDPSGEDGPSGTSAVVAQGLN